ncbi:Lrp/AsnC family transcriptional regulator [Halomonas sp. NO4]|uniref:siroheme decarboxylase subunit beta n=1 Tax=Halomonas sp. NO4 TaxID=2484813 RepID=UPI0013D1DBAF|nr:Lrp/AsnC family transcriptional regulator [Halomonas sp. NO4]
MTATPSSIHSAAEQRLRALLEQGLPLTARPWQRLAEQCGLTEAEVLDCVARWQREGLIKRLGLVVRHRALGIAANAMVVWDVDDEAVGELGRQLADEPAVTLCYRRPRRPGWPYNLFCMIHGTRRAQVEAQLAEIVARQGLEAIPHCVLFSHRLYKQCGGRFTPEDTSHERRARHPL